MTQDDFIVLKITRDDVESGYRQSTDELIDALVADDDTISKQEGKLFWDFSEFDDEGVEPGEIPALRDYVAALDARHPYLPYFLSLDEGASQLALYVSLLVSFSIEGETIRFDRQSLERFAVQKIEAISRFAAEHGIDPRARIRRFCEALHLDVIEEMVEEKGPYPFVPERITSPFLIEFFKTGYYFHTIDASDEPVLFSLVDDPTAAYYADASLSVELFPSGYYPVVALEMTIYDIPENPLKMTFVYNVELEQHRRELHAYAEMSYISTNFLYREKGELFYAFTRAVELPDDLRIAMRGLVLQASNLLRAVPKEARNFTRAVEELFAYKARSPEEKPQAPALSIVAPPSDEGAGPAAAEPPLPPEEPAIDDGIPIGEPEIPPPPENREPAFSFAEEPEPPRKDEKSERAFSLGETSREHDPNWRLDEPAAAPLSGAADWADQANSQDNFVEGARLIAKVPRSKTKSAEKKQPAEEAHPKTEPKAVPSARAPEILGEMEVLDGRPEPADAGPAEEDDGVAGQRRALRSPYDSSIPTSVLPESIQRITKALSKPLRRSPQSVTEALTIAPAPKKVMMRSEDQLERLSRRLMIMQNNTEKTERENLRLLNELKTAREEIERLQRENLSLESRWWKFWK
ncbi:MAG: DUF1817 domain-containing protein [Myxococcales bacterium]|nr:MAG: DUF1817 domain-containing protein [Myxococcales bacterium]